MTAPREERRPVRHTLIALVQDHPGVLNRVVSLFRRRGYNIESLAVGASETPGLSRMTIVVDVRDVDQVVNQFRRLIEVQTVRSVTTERTVVRETALVKVAAPESRRSALRDLAHRAFARVIHAGEEAVLLEITARPDEVNAFVAHAREYGAVELTRSGQIAMTLGAASFPEVPVPYFWQADGAAEDALA
jgi:acetolactate synthase I/III small subunit